MLDAVVSGLLSGGAIAMLGVCIVFMFRMVRLVNFAQVAVGTWGCYVASWVAQERGWAYVPAAALGVLAATTIGIAAGVVLRAWFSDASIEVRSTVSIAILIALVTAGTWVFGTDPRPMPTLLPGSGFNLGDVPVDAAAVVALGLAAALVAVLVYVLTRTRLGVRLRAMSERPDAAELLGVPTGQMTVAVWAIAAAVSAIAVLLAAPTRQSDFSSLSFQLLLPAVAAAALSLQRNFIVAALGGLLIGIGQAGISYYGSVAAWADALPLAVIAIVLLWTQRREVWDVAR